MVSKEIIAPLSYREITHPEIATIRVYPTLEACAKASAMVIAELVQENPQARITYATGNTMIPVYARLHELSRGKLTDFTQTTAFHLDEYVGLGPDHPDSFVGFLRKRVFEPLGIQNVNELNGLAEKPSYEAARYERLLVSAPIDLTILGLGPGAHIAFNEPGTPFLKRTHIAPLSKETVERDRKGRGQDTPARALTQGIANIKDARNIILIAYGEEKGAWLSKALYGEITPDVPASALRQVGEKVRIFIDEEAASAL